MFSIRDQGYNCLYDCMATEKWRSVVDSSLLWATMRTTRLTKEKAKHAAFPVAKKAGNDQHRVHKKCEISGLARFQKGSNVAVSRSNSSVD